jgi:hypothetical protein
MMAAVTERMSRLLALKLVFYVMAAAVAALLLAGLTTESRTPIVAKEASPRASRPREAMQWQPVDPALEREILERPLFTRGRRPPPPSVTPPPPAIVAAAPPQAWEWRLAGIMIAPARKEALLMRQGEKRATVEGDRIDGWRVLHIEPDRIVLGGDDGEKVLTPEPNASTRRVAPNPILVAAAKRGRMTPSAIIAETEKAKAAFAAAAAKLATKEAARLKRIN